MHWMKLNSFFSISEALRIPAVIGIANLQDKALDEGEVVVKLYSNEPDCVLSAFMYYSIYPSQ